MTGKSGEREAVELGARRSREHNPLCIREFPILGLIEEFE